MTVGASRSVFTGNDEVKSSSAGQVTRKSNETRTTGKEAMFAFSHCTRSEAS